MPNLKALSERVQQLMTNVEVVQQTNKRTGQKQYVPAIATGDIKKGSSDKTRITKHERRLGSA